MNTTAGKPAITKDAYPAQLMAALYAAGGMAASALSSSTKSNTSNSVREACSKTMKRCSDVNDGKFYTLLKFLSSDTSPDDKTLITDIAFANYLYGAEKYGMDQMPMWKRCLDCAISTSNGSGENHQSYMNVKAIVPLKNMIRIAQSKGNTKRVEELRVWLVCAYIGAIQSRLNNDDSDRKEETVFSKMSMRQLADAFFLRKTSLVKLERESLECLLELAGECLSAYPKPMDATSDESKLLYFYLQTQIHHLSEESKIYEEVQELVRAKKNRLPENEAKSSKNGKLSTDAVKSSSVTVTAADKIEMYKQTRRKVLLGVWSQWYDAQEKEFVLPGLRDAINHCAASGPLLNDCLWAVKLQIEGLFETAIALQQRRNKEKRGNVNVTSEACLSCWNQLLTFVSPLLMGYLSAVISKQNDTTGSIKGSLEHPLETLLGSVSQSIVSAAWMCDPFMSRCTATMHEATFQKVPHLLSTVHQCLMLLQTSSRRNQSSEESAQKKAFSSGDGFDSSKMELLLLEYSAAATEVRVDLTTALCADGEISTNSLTTIAHKSTLAAVALTKSGVELKTSSKFGTSFLQFISAWSGLYMTPWPFCNLGQGRTILRNARDSLVQAGKVWGREVGSDLEEIVLSIGEADLEGGITGGFVEKAKQLYKQALEALASLDIGDGGVRLLRVHCLVGLSRISSLNGIDSERYARAALDSLSEMEAARSSRCALICVYAWDEILLNNFARSYHDSLSRQLVAETLIRSARLDEAHSFLLDAVKSTPFNFDASFALGAFNLRKLLLFSNSGSQDFDTLKKDAKSLLLKSAKMSTTSTYSSPLPYALLGIFYEQDDIARAAGCYKKALSLDPSEPVSGRGLKRILPLEDMRHLCEASVKQHSAYNGWAWRIVGQLRLSKQGDYDSAAICFQQALRCRDIQDPDREVLVFFYTGPKVDNQAYCESAEIWCELGSCYRHMGKWSGSHRAYDSAYSVSKGNMSPNSLVDWAQVELELGLCDESITRCNEAIVSCANTQLKRLASYIKGKAIISMARQNLQDGKYGLAYGYIKMGVSIRGDSYSELKLLGDLYSVGEALPSYVFVEDISEFNNEYMGRCASNDDDEYHEYNITAEMKRKLRLLQAGKLSYSKALEMVRSESATEEENNLMAAAATDLGCNLLAQARIISLALGDGSGGETTTVSDLKDQHGHLRKIIEESIKSFMFAIESNPVDASAWCGLGCAIVAIDPLKAQHSFARALQLDKGIAEAWANMGVMFTCYDFRSIGSEILDALTQVEDTPLMWICRGLLFESSANIWQKQGSAREANLSKAADAYRAALQIYQHPTALLGLSLTCRRNDIGLMSVKDEIYSALACEASMDECLLSLSIYQSIAGDANLFAGHINLFMQLEKALRLLK